MNYNYFILFSLFIPFIARPMHIKDLSTVVSFDGFQKSIFEWLRDNRYHDFGKTPIYYTTSNERLFQKLGIVENIEDITLEKIALGSSIYSTNLISCGSTDRGHVIVCCHDKNSADINDELIKKIDNNLKLATLKILCAQDRKNKKI